MATGRVAVLALLGITLLVGVVGCISRIPDYGRGATRIEAAFPAFAELGLRELYVRGGRDGMTACTYVDYERGRFASARRCKSFLWGQAIPDDLDDQAWVDVKRLGEALDDPDGFWYAEVDYGSNGTIRSGNFVVDSCGSYQYEPDYGELPDLDSEDAVAVDDDWYVITYWLGDFLSGC